MMANLLTLCSAIVLEASTSTVSLSVLNLRYSIKHALQDLRQVNTIA